MFRNAPFIWIPDQKIDNDIKFTTLLREGCKRRDDGKNRWFLFRRTFNLSASVMQAECSITVDGRYQLFVNGSRLGRGPCRSSPAYQRYDQYDISSSLVQGINVMAVLVHVYGVDTGWYETAKAPWQTIFGDGGLYCYTRIDISNSLIEIATDTNWRCCQCTAWNSATPRSGWGQQFIEEHDARKMPQDWLLAEFDDTHWPQAQLMVTDNSPEQLAKGWSPVEPFPTLLKNDLPPLAEQAIAPNKVLGVYGVLPRPELSIDRRIYDEELIDPPAGTVQESSALLSPNDNLTLVRTESNCDIAILIRFDPVHSGYPFIEIEAQGDEIIEAAISETIPGEYEGVMPDLPRPVCLTHLDCAHVFRYIARPGKQRFEMFHWTAVRYMQLVVRNAPKGIKIRHVGSIYTHYPAEHRGAFECSDSSLNRLWEIGRYTTLQCTHDAWEDCPGREKRQWLGDGTVHYSISAAAFGPSTQPIDRQYLLLGMESQRPDGLLQMFTPGDNHTDGIIIPDYGLQWTYAARDYLLHIGDDTTIEEIFPCMQRILAWFSRQIGPNDLLVDIPHWNFIEWANFGRQGEAATINAMFVGALQAAAEIAQHLGYERARQRYTSLADSVALALNSRHWDAKRNIYVDMVNPRTGEQHPQVSQHANACMILWDIAPQSRWSQMVTQISDRSRLKLTAVPPIVMTDEPFDSKSDIVRANTSFNHFVFSALAKAGRFDLTLDLIRGYYGPMLETDTDTVWESFEATASICHAFSATPVYQLSAHALGIRPIAPGFKQFLIAPQTVDLNFARGVYPSVHGDIPVEWHCADGKLELSVTVPADTIATVETPPGYKQKGRLKTLKPGAHRLQFEKLALKTKKQ